MCQCTPVQRVHIEHAADMHEGEGVGRRQAGQQQAQAQVMGVQHLGELGNNIFKLQSMFRIVTACQQILQRMLDMHASWAQVSLHTFAHTQGAQPQKDGCPYGQGLICMDAYLLIAGVGKG